MGEEGVYPPDVKMEADVTFNLEFVACWLKNTVVSTVVVFEQLDVQEPDRVIQGEGKLRERGKKGRRLFSTLNPAFKSDMEPYRTNPLLEMISAWQSLTVSPLRLSSSPLTQRFPGSDEREHINVRLPTSGSQLCRGATP